MTATVRIRVGWDSESDHFWFDLCDPGDTDSEMYQQEGDVPSALWEQYLVAWRTIAECETALRSHIDIEPGGHRRSPCVEYVGHEPWTSPASFAVEVPASGSDDVFPIRPVPVGFFVESRGAADAYLRELPDELWLIVNGHPVRVKRAELRVIEVPAWTSTPTCERCGWSIDEHVATDEVNGGEA